MQWYFFLPIVVFCSACSTGKENVPSPHLPIIPEPRENHDVQPARISYLVRTGKPKEAIDEIIKAKDAYLFHSNVLQELGLSLLEQGLSSRNPQDTLLALYGAGISLNEQTIPAIEATLSSEDPNVQLVAVNVLSTFDTDEANCALEEAMRSDYVIVRIEAAYHLASKKHKRAFEQLHALFTKLPPDAKPLIPYLFAMEGSPASLLELKRLLYEADQNVRIETLLAIKEFARDDLIDDVKKLVNDPSPSMQEAVASTLASFQDEHSQVLLEHFAYKQTSPALAAFLGLYILGDQEALYIIEEEAQNNNLFALSLLGKIPQANPRILYQKITSDNLTISANATLALLERKDRKAFIGLPKILIDTPKDVTFQPIFSVGRSFSSWKAVPSSAHTLSKEPMFYELSLRMREDALTQALELPEDDFLAISEMIFSSEQRDLIPLLVHLLENMHSDKAIELLALQEQKPGSPFIRAWCNLALYRMHVPGPWAENLRKWVKGEKDESMFQTRPVLPWKMRMEKNPYTLTLEEKSRLLIESFQALAESQDEESTEALLRAIQTGNPHNRYTLAGLLMRSAQ